MGSGGAFAGVTLFLIVLGIVVAILWILLPFAVFGLKGLLRQAISQQQRTNELLATLAEQGKASAPPPAPPWTAAR